MSTQSAPHKKRKTDLFPYLMCLPALILFVLFVLAPFFTGLYTSFFRWDGFDTMKWVGLDNYKFSLSDDIFWLSLKNTLVFAVCVTIVKNIVALALAFVLSKSFIGRTVFRTGIYLPVTLSYIVIGILWVWIFNPTFGLLNELLRLAGLENLILGWLSDPDIALYTVVAVDSWKWIGYHMVLYLAGLQAIPQSLYEAADIDGAGPLTKLFRVTIPQLNSTIVVNVVMSMTGAFVANYDIVYIMTDGGPFHSTEVALTHIMTTAYKYSALGKANAMSIILFAIVLIFGFAQLKMMARDDNYNN